MRASRRRGVLAVLAVGAIGIAAACGGSDDSESSGLSAEEFRSQADAICAKYDEQTDAIAAPGGPDEVEAYFTEVIPIQQQQLTELQALEPPEDLSARFDEATGLLEEQISLAQQAVDQISGGTDPATAVQSFSDEADANGDRLDALATELGLTECGNDDSGGDDTDTSGTDTTATTLDTTGGDATTTEDVTTEESGDTTGDTVEPTTTYGDDALQIYITDVSDAANALVQFGTILQSVSSPEDLSQQADAASAQLDTFDAAMAQIATYRLSNAQLEEQRAGLVATSGNVSTTLRDFTAAAAAGDLEEAQALLPQVQTALSEFQAAAAGSSSTP